MCILLDFVLRRRLWCILEILTQNTSFLALGCCFPVQLAFLGALMATVCSLLIIDVWNLDYIAGHKLLPNVDYEITWRIAQLLSLVHHRSLSATSSTHKLKI